MKILGSIHEDGEPHSYCPDCWSRGILPYHLDGKEYYRCDRCGYDDSRLIMFYPQMRYRIMEDRELLHYTVGAVIEWQGKYLLFRRRLFPFKYTIVAGHWDSSDSTPEAAITREIEEEAGIELHPADSPIVETLNDPCRRGADFHEWRLYRFKVLRHMVTMSDEADIIGWYSPEEIRGIDLTIPTEHFFRKLQIL
ncbi:MAG: NUDIX hydrolase [bacterium]|nr:NUDIX hydrolase [bacterium]